MTPQERVRLELVMCGKNHRGFEVETKGIEHDRGVERGPGHVINVPLDRNGTLDPNVMLDPHKMAIFKCEP